MATGQGGYQTLGMTVAVAGQVTAGMLVAADTQIVSGSQPQTLAVPLGLIGSQINVNPNVTATAGGNQATGKLVPVGATNVNVVATAADSIKLPPAVAGAIVVLRNSGAASMQVFGGGTSTINAAATATGVAQANATTAIYFCLVGDGSDVAGVWVRVLSA